MLEREQLVRLMSEFADVFFVKHWDPEIGGRRLENKAQQGESVPEGHLRAWRIAREEVLANVLRWVRLVMTNYFAYTAKLIHEDRVLHTRLPDELWDRIGNFLDSLSRLPCWIDKNLSTTVFGPKQNLDYWEKVFEDWPVTVWNPDLGAPARSESDDPGPNEIWWRSTMKRVPNSREVAQSLKAVHSSVKQALKELNQSAGQLMAKGDYSSAEALAAKGREIREFQAQVEVLQQRWRELRGSRSASSDSKKTTTPLWAYYQPILKALAEAGGEARAVDLESSVERNLGEMLQPSDRVEMSHGRQRWQES